MPTATSIDYAVSAWYMEHHDDSKNSHKFYQTFLFANGAVVLRWGRVGTLGQSSVSRYPTYEAAKDVALRQVYAKKSKGYVSQYDDMKFVVDQKTVDGLAQGGVAPLVQALNTAMDESRYAGARDAVLQHYTAFSEKAQQLLHRAADADLQDVMADYEALEAVWDDIEAIHDEVQVAMNLAKSTLTQKLMGGS